MTLNLHYTEMFVYVITVINELLLNFRSSDEAVKPKLPKPAIGESALQTSVFCNPFVEAELAKAAILEKHVKMVHVDFLLPSK